MTIVEAVGLLSGSPPPYVSLDVNGCISTDIPNNYTGRPAIARGSALYHEKLVSKVLRYGTC